MSQYVIVNGSLYNATELYHHGVKGMRWGVRKAVQNAANSIKDARRKRREAAEADMSPEAREMMRLKKKKTSQMTNAELRKLNDRQNLEKQHSNLNPSAVKKGLAIAAGTAAAFGTAAALYANSKQLIKIGKEIAPVIMKAGAKIASSS